MGLVKCPMHSQQGAEGGLVINLGRFYAACLILEEIHLLHQENWALGSSYFILLWINTKNCRQKAPLWFFILMEYM